MTKNDEATWAVDNGLLIGKGKGVGILTKKSDFLYFELECEVSLSGGVNSGLFFGASDSKRECELAIPSHDRFHALGSIIGMKPWAKVKKRVNVERGEWLKLRLLNSKNEMRVEVNGEVVVLENMQVSTAGPLRLANLHESGQIAIRKIQYRTLR